MKIVLFFTIFSLGLLIVGSPSLSSAASSKIVSKARYLKKPSPKVIHGSDNRILSQSLTDTKLRESLQYQVLAMIPKYRLLFTNDHSASSPTPFYQLAEPAVRYGDLPPVVGSQAPLCPHTAFYGLPMLSECTAFWVNAHQVATAAHCLLETSCDDWWFVSGFTQDQPWLFSEQQVFTCQKVVNFINAADSQTSPDLILLEMNQHLPNAVASQLLPLKTSNLLLSPGQEIFAAGHPWGLPLIISQQGQIVSVEKDPSFVFTSNLDTFPGNSGSPIISKSSGQIIGVHSSSVHKIYTLSEQNSCWELVHYPHSKAYAQEQLIDLISDTIKE